MVKIGIRKPSIKKSVKARTTGKAKRAIKRSVNPVYGKKGMGWVNNPKKAAYNKVYNKTTKSVTNFGSTKRRKSHSTTSDYTKSYGDSQGIGCGCLTLLLAVFILPILIPFFPIAAGVVIFAIVIISLIGLGTRRNYDSDLDEEEYDADDNGIDEERWDDF